MTVDELRKALEGLPGNAEVCYSTTSAWSPIRTVAITTPQELWGFPRPFGAVLPCPNPNPNQPFVLID